MPNLECFEIPKRDRTRVRDITLRITVAILAIVILSGTGHAVAIEGQHVGAFLLPADQPDTIVLTDSIGGDTALEFLRALKKRPEARFVSLNSEGGLVTPALMIAHSVFDRGLSTVVPAGSVCLSACAYIFFAGRSRAAFGELGVHQISGGDASDAQSMFSNVLDALTEFGVPEEVVSIMLRTPPDQIHIFDPGEVATLSINQARVESPKGHADLPQGATFPKVDPASVSGSQSLVLEASDTGSAGAVPFLGTLQWSKGVDERGNPTLIGRADIPARDLVAQVLIRKNYDQAVSAGELIEIKFTVADGFTGGSIAGLPGVLLKNEEFVQGTPLVGASARVALNSFLFELSRAPADATTNMEMLTSLRWIDLALIYASGKRALVTLEKDDEAQRMFSDVLSAWRKVD